MQMFQLAKSTILSSNTLPTCSFAFLPAKCKSSYWSGSLTALSNVRLLHFLPTWCKIVARVVFVCILLIINEVDLFICWLAFMSYFWEMPVAVFCSCVQRGCQLSVLQITSPQLVACLFIFFVMSWWVKVLNFKVIEFMNIFSRGGCFLFCWGKPFPFRVIKIPSYIFSYESTRFGFRI